uniref:Putative leucine-rich repeat receptor-like protein kinase n=1 Tax=Tetraselmis sp. GSL018 TaxID=582737 RepID=A0A061RK54_9CHLO
MKVLELFQITILVYQVPGKWAEVIDWQILFEWRSSLEPNATNSKLLTWTNDTDPCKNWAGIGCVQNRVTSIALDGEGLQGTLPGSWSQLRTLRSISLKFNQFQGDPIQKTWSKLTDLLMINLADNKLDGELPLDLNFFRSLKYLYLMNNRVAGRLPRTIGSLEYMSLDGNRIAGQLPSWRNASFVSLKLGSNDLSGTVPVEWSSWQRLKFLEMPGNRLEGSIPAAVDPLLRGLTVLSLRENTLDEAPLRRIASSGDRSPDWSLFPQQLPKPKLRDEHELFAQQGPREPTVVGAGGLPDWAVLVLVLVSTVLVLAAITSVAVLLVRRSLRMQAASQAIHSEKGAAAPTDDSASSALPSPEARRPSTRSSGEDGCLTLKGESEEVPAEPYHREAHSSSGGSYGGLPEESPRQMDGTLVAIGSPKSWAFFVPLAQSPKRSPQAAVQSGTLEWARLRASPSLSDDSPKEHEGLSDSHAHDGLRPRTPEADAGEPMGAEPRPGPNAWCAGLSSGFADATVPGQPVEGITPLRCDGSPRAVPRARGFRSGGLSTPTEPVANSVSALFGPRRLPAPPRLSWAPSSLAPLRASSPVREHAASRPARAASASASRRPDAEMSIDGPPRESTTAGPPLPSRGVLPAMPTSVTGAFAQGPRLR